MPVDIRSLLDGPDDLPDVYQLTSRPQFDPDRAGLSAAAREAIEQLRSLGKRASEGLHSKVDRLRRELIEFSDILDDDERLRQFETQRIAELARRYAIGMAGKTPAWSTTEVEHWLAIVQNVAPMRVVEVATRMIELNASALSTDSAAGADSHSQPKGGAVRWREIASTVQAEPGLMLSPRPRTSPSGSLRPESGRPASPAASTPPVPPHRSPNPLVGTAVALPISKRMTAGEKALWIVGGIVIGLVIPTGIGGWLLWNKYVATRQPSSSAPVVSRQTNADPPAAADTSLPPSKAPPEPPAVSPPAPSPASPTSPVAIDPSKPASATDMAPIPVPVGDSKVEPPAIHPPVPTPPKTTMPLSESVAVPPNPRPPAEAADSPIVLVGALAASAIAWNKDGSLLATGDAIGTLRLWDPESGRVEHELNAGSGGILCMAFSDDDRLLAVGRDDGTLALINLADRSEREITADGIGKITALAWRFERPQLLIGDENGQVVSCSLNSDGSTKAMLRNFIGGGPVRHISRSRQISGLHFAVCYGGGIIALWNADAPMPERALMDAEHLRWDSIQETFMKSRAVKGGRTTYVPHRQPESFATAWNPQGTELAVAGGDVETWSLGNTRGAVRGRLLPGYGEMKGYLCVDWSTDGKLLASGDATGRLVVWDVTSTTPKQHFGRTLSQAVTHVAWTGGAARRLAVGCEDGNVRIWKIDERREPGPFLEVEKLLENGARFAQDEDPEMLHRVVQLLQTQNLTQSQGFQRDAWRVKLKSAGAAMYEELAKQSATDIVLVDALLTLQIVVDWNPDSKTLAEAKKKLEMNIPSPPDAVK
jgi:WD40 repeat protein